MIRRFKVTATSPMSGAYDMTGEQEKYMFQKYPKPFYLPYLLTSYQDCISMCCLIRKIFTLFSNHHLIRLLPYFFDQEFIDRSFEDLDKLMPPSS
jgi:hypothetical protein